MPKPQTLIPLNKTLAAEIDALVVGDQTVASIRVLLQEANTLLSERVLVKAAAENVALAARKRGAACVFIGPDGNLYVSVTRATRTQKATEPVVRRKRRVAVAPTTEPAAAATPAATSDDGDESKLPKINELRTRATALGIDHSVFGIKRKPLWAAIQKAEADSAAAEGGGTSEVNIDDLVS